MSDARADVLARIGAALGADRPPQQAATEPAYRLRSELDEAERLALFADRVAEYQATVRRVPAAEARAAIAAAVAAHGARRVVVAPDLGEERIPADLEVLVDHGLTAVELDGVDGALTSAALAVAQTGTIALDGGPGQGRRVLTLVPDLHVCVVEADRVVGSIPEAIAALEDGAREHGRPLTLISGPSATSDIELNRVEGVHGPRRLEVVLVG